MVVLNKVFVFFIGHLAAVPGKLGSGPCTDQIIISSDLNKWWEGTYTLMDHFIAGKVAFSKDSEGDVILSYNEETLSWNIKSKANKIQAWGLNYDGDCPQGADESWHVEPTEVCTGFTMTSGMF